MSDPTSHDEAADRRMAERLRDLPEAQAEPAFRDRLRQAFQSGEIEASARARTVPRRRSGAQVDLRSLRPWLAVAAVLVLVVGITFLNQGPRLAVLDVGGSGEIVVNGRPVSHTDRARLQALLQSERVIEVPEGMRLDLGVPGTAVYELTSGTRMTLPASPARWFGRAVSCSLQVGEMRFQSGPDFAGSRLTVSTPDGIVHVVGTLVSVQSDASGTCVCVLDGSVRVGRNVDDLQQVAAGWRKIMLRDGRTDIVPAAPPHTMGLQEFSERLHQLPTGF